MNPAKDGVDHVNIFSRGRTELGRWLSNFTREPIQTEDGHFMSIEGYWYWLSRRDDRLRDAWGYQAKQLGQSLPEVTRLGDAEFKGKILRAMRLKLEANPAAARALRENKLPLAHYYVFGGTVRSAGFRWIVDAWERMARE